MQANQLPGQAAPSQGLPTHSYTGACRLGFCKQSRQPRLQHCCLAYLCYGLQGRCLAAAGKRFDAHSHVGQWEVVVQLANRIHCKSVDSGKSSSHCAADASNVPTAGTIPYLQKVHERAGVACACRLHIQTSNDSCAGHWLATQMQTMRCPPVKSKIVWMMDCCSGVRCCPGFSCTFLRGAQGRPWMKDRWDNGHTSLAVQAVVVTTDE